MVDNSSLNEREKRLKLDDEMIQRMLDRGADLQKEYVVDFLFVGDQASLNRLEPNLLGQGYEKNTAGSKNNRLLVQKKVKLEIMKSHIIAESMESLSKEFGVAFDGWGMEI